MEEKKSVIKQTEAVVFVDCVRNEWSGCKGCVQANDGCTVVMAMNVMTR